jgi:hypothetical protein
MIGIGMAPDQSWGSNSVGINFGIGDTDAGAITWREVSGADDFCFTWNAYNDNTNWKYASNNPSSKFNMTNGKHVFATAASGSADANITYLENLRMNTSGAVFNDGGIDLDFRVESDTEANAFTVDGETGQVGVGSRRGFRFGNATLEGNMGSSGSGYPTIGYNIRFQGTGGQFGTLVGDTSWRMDFGANNRLQVHSRSSSGIVTGAASYTAGPYVTLNGTSWTNGSDARLKENVSLITDAIDTVKAMRPVNYTWIHDGENAPNQIGFIAQEMALVVPEVVDVPETETDAITGDTLMWGIQYDGLVPVLTAALQEALTKIETLETRLTALENA